MCGNPKETNSPLTALEDDKKESGKKMLNLIKWNHYTLFSIDLLTTPFLNKELL